MRKPPCEWRIRNIVPLIRATLATLLIKEYGLSIYQAAKILDVTPAAISNYLALRRPKVKIIDKLLNDPIVVSHFRDLARKLLDNEVEAGDVICELCQKFTDYLRNLMS
ncbi:MAG: hypothetical protein DRO18_00110 [Thermoprotei archaeon]|nr:MAG: hypothetical protein DRO18_00110 [Thermoprotei archaeon]HDN75864.1 hypothetical protein [Acidilobales archaeon]